MHQLCWRACKSVSLNIILTTPLTITHGPLTTTTVHTPHLPPTHPHTPAGFFFRQQTYGEVERVLDMFKRDPNYKKKQKADGMGPRMGGHPGAPAGYGQQPPAAGGYGQPGSGYTPHHGGGYTPHNPQQQAGGYVYGGPPAGYVPGGQQPYRPAAAAAAGPYGRPPGAPPAAAGYGAPPGGYGGGGGQPPPYQSGYAPNPGYNQPGGYQQHQQYYSQAR